MLTFIPLVSGSSSSDIAGQECLLDHFLSDNKVLRFISIEAYFDSFGLWAQAIVIHSAAMNFCGSLILIDGS